MKNGWENITLGSVCDIFSGFAFKSDDLGDEGIPVLKIANIQGKKVLSECKDSFPTSMIDDKLAKYFLQDDDILVAMTGAGSVGKMGKMRKKRREFLVNQRVAIVRLKSDFANAEFIYQVLSQDKYETILYNIGLGAGQPNVSPEQIRRLIIPSPTIETQNKIASILSAYDDLIENNTRRIKILEEMARLIYREWFVEFKVPGLKLRKATPEEKEVTGKDVFPEGWEVTTVNDVCSRIGSGGTPSRGKEEYWQNGEIDWFKTKELNDTFLIDSEEKITKEGINKSSAKMFPKSTIIMALYAAPTVGRMGILTEESTFNQAACGMIPDNEKIGLWYLYFALLNLRSYFNSISRGAAQQNINGEILKEAKIIKSPIDRVLQFEKIISPVYELILNLNMKNRYLRLTRDLLLPKLIGGEVEV